MKQPSYTFSALRRVWTRWFWRAANRLASQSRLGAGTEGKQHWPVSRCGSAEGTHGFEARAQRDGYWTFGGVGTDRCGGTGKQSLGTLANKQVLVLGAGR